MHAPTLFRDRSDAAQVVIGGLVPMLIGGLAGVLVGVSAAGYWAVAALAAVGAFLAGFEHTDGWDAADRGLLGGVIYGTALLLAHELAATRPLVSLGSVPALLAVVTAIAGMLLSAAGGHISGLRRRSAPLRGRGDRRSA